MLWKFSSITLKVVKKTFTFYHRPSFLHKKFQQTTQNQLIKRPNDNYLIIKIMINIRSSHRLIKARWWRHVNSRGTKCNVTAQGERNCRACRSRVLLATLSPSLPDCATTLDSREYKWDTRQLASRGNTKPHPLVPQGTSSFIENVSWMTFTIRLFLSMKVCLCI